MHTFFRSWVLSNDVYIFVWVMNWHTNHWKKHIPACVWASLLLAQIILVFVFGMIRDNGSQIIRISGYMVWILSAVFGWWPILVLKRRGGVDTGKSYVYTSKLVDSGPYAVVRHPQYMAGILFNLALILISQTSVVTLIGMVGIVLMYLDIAAADKHELQKFGDQYRQYMKRVPGTNFILGMIRLLRKRKAGASSGDRF